MTDNIQNHRDHFKAIAVNTQGTPTQKLLAVLAEFGITDTTELAEVTGLKPRAIQTAKRNTLRATECGATHCAQHIAPKAHSVAPEAQSIAPAKKVSPTPPSKNNTTTTIQPSIAAREAAALPIDAKLLESRILAACNGSLANPAAAPGLLSMSTPMMWIEHGADLERDVIPTLTALGKKYHGKNIRTWDYFTGPIAEAKAKRQAGMPTVAVSGSQRPAPKAFKTPNQFVDASAETQRWIAENCAVAS